MSLTATDNANGMVACLNCGKSNEPGRRFCSHCLSEMKGENTSGAGFSAAVPQEIKGLNWGAFFIPLLWGIFNKVWLAVLSLLPMVGVVMSFILLFKGNEWAWQSKHWDSIEQFKRTQRKWMYWGIAAFLAPFVLILGIGLIVFGLLGYYGYIR
ncbi:MAG: zinc ribbon domain-containing protein [Chloroflexi bacterium]|nr:zinc ribbon domain-containing protein [Chloroflexota bacterium]MBM3172376.1 zinc ribbon domain-containing protein [Chloroflexota bacterium]MBM3174802.1 zinc ribbon domain-containing protein [Chloroflexota bacterium]MBM4449988.1 zinc ribbon domain-containing protein [Chloroflexota bacterium]